MFPFVDSHAHLDGPDFDADRADVLARAGAAGLTHVVCIGASDGFASNGRTLGFVEARDGFFATVGIHPHDARILDEPTFAALSSMADHPKVVGIGETGLDYFYDQSPREEQQAAFHRFLELAEAKRKPVVIHTRDAEADTLAILRSHRVEATSGVLHCFTGTRALAEAAVELGLYVSFSGILTFKTADDLRETARALPRERVLVETDCPYLAPVPKRGKRNEPAFIVHTVERLADLWGIEAQDVRRITGENALRLFGLPPPRSHLRG